MTTTLTTKGQVTIPKQVRKTLHSELRRLLQAAELKQQEAQVAISGLEIRRQCQRLPKMRLGQVGIAASLMQGSEEIMGVGARSDGKRLRKSLCRLLDQTLFLERKAQVAQQTRIVRIEGKRLTITIRRCRQCAIAQMAVALFLEIVRDDFSVFGRRK